MLDEKIIGQCILSEEKLKLNCEYTNPESIKNAFVKRIFLVIRDMYFNDEKVDIESLFYKLPKETRRSDLQKIVELML